MIEHNNRLIYLDNAATTRPAPEVVAAMTEALERDYGNPSSRHGMGLAADRRIRQARAQVARRLAVPPSQVVFTSGGTEALALGILGTVRQRRTPGHILVSAIEHPAVLNTAQIAQQLGHTVETVPVVTGGWVDPAEVARRLRDETFLVAVMHVNNEIGVTQPVQEISRLVKNRQPRCRVLVDAVQSFGVLETNLARLGADIVAISAHKLHGPKGVGAFGMAHELKLSPLWGGGGQEAGLRPGTENVPGIVGLGVAAETGKGDAARLRDATRSVAEAIIRRVPGAYALGDEQRRAAHIIALALPGVRSDVLVNALADKGVYVSSGAACHSRGAKRSRVLAALGVPDEHGVIRVSPSRFTSDDDLARASEAIVSTIEALR